VPARAGLCFGRLRANLPRFQSGIPVLEPASLRYNPRDDVMFPSVVEAGGRIPGARARYYLYYAPHSAPGGLCVAFADQLAGPWREYEANPVVTCAWPPHHDVEHVSSPHANWRADRGELWLYYHGDNEVTRWATSSDGLHFQYGGVAIEAARYGMDGASYARVFESPFPDGPAPLLMTLLLYRYVAGSWERFERFGLFGAWSHDGATWSLVERPILAHDDIGRDAFICSPFVAPLDDRIFMLYHLDDATGLTDVHAVEIDATLRPLGPPVLVCPRDAFGPDNQRAADPFLIVENHQPRLLCSIGPRLSQRIGLATPTPVDRR
jgi:hypothetical protein